MAMYSRKEPHYALCGLNCCLCPRFHTDGSSKCPGCGGEEFSNKHPTCAVVTCSKRHGSIEFCFQCKEYPCDRYKKNVKVDSFITYMNVLLNFEHAKTDLKEYLKILEKKHGYLVQLLESYNDGKSKSLYCTAIELFPLNEIEDIMKTVKNGIDGEQIEEKEKARKVVNMVKERAKELNISLVLRK